METIELNTPSGVVEIRLAQLSDLEAFRELRLEALVQHPTAFSADYQTHNEAGPGFWKEYLAERTIFLATQDGNLVGMMGIHPGGSPKTRHSAVIWGVYVRSAWRGLGIAQALIRSCLNWASANDVVMVKLAVAIPNEPAVRCYEMCGFDSYGIEPRAIFFEGRYHDELMMACRLD